tara:strand:+ start:54 stop:569 length:516 start_codon:yes stop_codon:yes gene_type:complete
MKKENQDNQKSLNDNKRKKIMKDIESKKIEDSLNVSNEIIKEFKLLETSEEKIDFLESNRKLLTQIDVDKYIENLKSKKNIFKDIKKNSVQIVKSNIKIDDMKNNVKVKKTVDTSAYLKNNKITQCKFSIDLAVRLQRKQVRSSRFKVDRSLVSQKLSEKLYLKKIFNESK